MNLKNDLRDLAILGGTPAFSAPLHVGKPTLPRAAELLPRVAAILERSWYTNDGPLVREFEARVAELAGVRHCVAMSNGTAALEVALRALDLQGEIIVPAFTFIASAHCASWLGLTPVFGDVNPSTHLLEVGEAARLMTDRTVGILPVHLWGRPCDVTAFDEFARANRLALVYDAAHAFGCSSAGRPIGGSGAVEVFSFHATKFVTTGEGGAATTNDDGLAARLRLMRNFGFAGYDNVVSVGTNAKMSEFAAAVGLTSLAGMAETMEANGRNHALYSKLLAGARGLEVMPYDPATSPNYQYVIVEIEAAETGISRDTLQAVLRAENILARRYFYPGCHRMEPYRRRPDRRSLPATERLAETVLALPTGLATPEDAIESVCDIIHFVISGGEALSYAIAKSAH